MARKARRRLPLGARAYLEGGSEDESTLRRNRAAFGNLEFLPVQPRNVSEVDTSTTLLGQRVPLPFVLSPTVSFPNIGPPDQRSLRKITGMFDGTVSWADLEWIRELWDGPILAKGVLRPEEAIEAAEHGLDGVIVSNHGGRQLDHLPATIDVLPRIVDAVGDRMEVLVDSGFRRGSDIVTALAFGARAVLLGRAHLYGLAAAGEAGVRHCIDILTHELRMTMQMCGATTIADLNPSLLRRGDGAGSSPGAAA